MNTWNAILALTILSLVTLSSAATRRPSRQTSRADDFGSDDSASPQSWGSQDDGFGGNGWDDDNHGWDHDNSGDNHGWDDQDDDDYSPRRGGRAQTSRGKKNKLNDKFIRKLLLKLKKRHSSKPRSRSAFKPRRRGF